MLQGMACDGYRLHIDHCMEVQGGIWRSGGGQGRKEQLTFAAHPLTTEIIIPSKSTGR